MTEDSPRLPPWEPTELDREIRYWIDFFTSPPDEMSEEERARNARLLGWVHERLSHLAAAAEPATRPESAPVATTTPPWATGGAPVTLGQALDALDRLALRCLSASMTDPRELATALRALDGVTALRRARRISRRVLTDILPTTWQVAEEVLDTIRFQVLTEPTPTWAIELAALLAQSEAELDLAAGRGAGPPVTLATPGPGPVDGIASYLSFVRGMELGHLEGLTDPDVDIGGDLGVLEGLEAIALLRLGTGITRDQEDALRRDVARQIARPGVGVSSP